MLRERGAVKPGGIGGSTACSRPPPPSPPGPSLLPRRMIGLAEGWAWRSTEGRRPSGMPVVARRCIPPTWTGLRPGLGLAVGECWWWCSHSPAVALRSMGTERDWTRWRPVPAQQSCQIDAPQPLPTEGVCAGVDNRVRARHGISIGLVCRPRRRGGGGGKDEHHSPPTIPRSSICSSSSRCSPNRQPSF
jgi:hypothetical protein